MAKKKASKADTEAQDEKDRSIGEAERWKTEIRLYEREADKFLERGKKIIKRYKDERSKGTDEHRNRLNILWSNVQTLRPALFAKNPKTNVERRYQSDDDAGRFASETLERCTSFYVDDKYFDCMNEVVLDRLLPGRGTAWVRYLPKFAPGSDTETDQEDLKDVTDDEAQAELISEELVVDYVHWQDFGHTWARTWEEVDAGWRKVYMDRDALIERFPKCGDKISLDHAPEKLNNEKVEGEIKKATIYQICDKKNKKFIWIHKDYPEPLDEIDDPLKLKEFFPFPRPLLATLANDTVIPTADYIEYQDQADELDEITSRITLLTKAVKVAGVYAGDAEGVQRLLSEGLENQIIPIDNWAMFAEKGGLKGVIDYLPIKDIVAAIASLYEVREKVKNDLYEISGLSDILRGAGDPNETATGVKTKGKFGTMRLSSMQGEVARFNRDLIRIMAEIISTHFSPETIKQLSGVQLLTVQEKQQAQMMLQQQAQMAQQQPPQPGQPPAQPPPIPEKLQEALDNPTWEDVIGLLKNDVMRAFRIDIEIDSTIKMDQDKERQDRIDFLTAAGGFIQQAATVQQPELMPLMMEMLMFGIRGFPVAKDIESAFEVAQKKIEKEAQNPTPKPDPETEKNQALVQLEKMKMGMQQQQSQADMQLEQQKAQVDAQNEQSRMQADNQIEFTKISHARDLEQAKLQHEGLKLTLQREIEYAKIQSQERMKSSEMNHQKSMADNDANSQIAVAKASRPEPDQEQAQKIDGLQQGQQMTLEAIGKAQELMEQQMKALLQIAQSVQQAVSSIEQTKKAVSAPKKIIRDKMGRVSGVTVDAG